MTSFVDVKARVRGLERIGFKIEWDVTLFEDRVSTVFRLEGPGGVAHLLRFYPGCVERSSTLTGVF